MPPDLILCPVANVLSKDLQEPREAPHAAQVRGSLDCSRRLGGQAFAGSAELQDDIESVQGNRRDAMTRKDADAIVEVDARALSKVP
ncbi:MAG: hypothetical protein DMG70_07045 [Acidobacteria bacterium]|nr:MAG: hypothetical protein DMG70_07045 [Acidobacteriota bacterium]PYY07411.1 MAG: hypothetical protein DMG69_19625 [Acidobacteriota bacterium]